MRTLVLNAGFEPLSVVSFKRAVILVLSGKATVLSADEDLVRAQSLSMERPSVIILRRYVCPPRRRRMTLSRRGVLRRDDFCCAYCQEPATTIDHVLPRSRGGLNTWENLVACCRSCNNRKGSRTPEEIGWTLQVPPRAPRASMWWVPGTESKREDWTQYLEYARAA